MNIVSANLPAPNFPMTPRALSVITDFIVHHEAGSTSETPQEVDQQHRAQGWSMCGYNWIIDQAGTVYSCRPVDVIPSAAYGRNTESVNVSLVGNFQSDDPGFTGDPTAAQIKSLEALCLWAHQQYPSIVRTIGHRDVAPMFYPNDQGDYSTACPGNKLYEQIPAIKASVGKALNPH